MRNAELLGRVREALENVGIEYAVLSHPESLAHLSGYEAPVEDYPVANPFVAEPALLVVTPTTAVGLIADCYASMARNSIYPVELYRSYDFFNHPDPPGELQSAFRRVLDAVGLISQRVGVESGWLPLRLADVLKERAVTLVDVEAVVVKARTIKQPVEIEALSRAAHLADTVQQAIKNLAEPGLTEAELAGLAQAAMYREAGRRVPVFLNVTAGVASATPPWEPTGRVIADGDLVLVDTAPWIDGAWGDSANAIVVGRPTAEHRRVFDDLRRALDLAIQLCRPGAVARDVHSKVRESLNRYGSQVYDHHTGHGIGASWSEEPRITPYNDMRIEVGMALAVEPAIYRPGWGGIRLEHMLAVHSSGNEVLTKFDHTL